MVNLAEWIQQNNTSTPNKYSWYSFLLEAELNSSHSVVAWNMSLKIPLTPSGIKHATFQFVLQCFNQLCHCVPLPNNSSQINNTKIMKQEKFVKHYNYHNCIFIYFIYLFIVFQKSIHKSSSTGYRNSQWVNKLALCNREPVTKQAG
jgi:hypothetical protein